MIPTTMLIASLIILIAALLREYRDMRGTLIMGSIGIIVCAALFYLLS